MAYLNKTITIVVQVCLFVSRTLTIMFQMSMNDNVSKFYNLVQFYSLPRKA